MCINFNAATYFGYRNEADQVVSVDPASSAVAGAEPDDEAYVPTLFAPGRVSPAFYVFAVDPEIPVSWTITGTDGVGRTATSDPQVPECTDELLQPTVPDERTPSIEIGAPQLSADGSTVTIETTAVGVPRLSVCADGLTAEPASVRMDDGNGGSTTAGNVSQWTADVLTFQPEGRRVATFIVSALVVDRCSGADVTQSSWPNGAFDDMRNGLTICATVTNTTVSIDSFYGGLCGGLAPTGGARIRPSANAG